MYKNLLEFFKNVQKSTSKNARPSRRSLISCIEYVQLDLLQLLYKIRSKLFFRISVRFKNTEGSAVKTPSA